MSSPSKDYDITYKVLVVGEMSVGKTSLIRRYSCPDRKMSMAYITTVGIDFVNIIKVVDNIRIRLQIWDTAGQERFRTFTKLHFRGTKGLILMYDLTNIETFEKLTNWLRDIKENGSPCLDFFPAKIIETELIKDSTLQSASSSQETFKYNYLTFSKENDSLLRKIQAGLEKEQLIIVGNKSDLEDERQVSRKIGEKLAHEFGFKFFETSAKENISIDEVFEELTKDMKDANNPYFVAKEPDPKYDGVNMARIEVVPADGTDGKINLVDEAKAPGSYSCCGS